MLIDTTSGANQRNKNNPTAANPDKAQLAVTF